MGRHVKEVTDPIGVRIEIERGRRRLTRGALAQLAGLSDQQLRNRMHSGAWHTRHLASLAEVLGVELEYLAGTWEEC